MSIIDVNQIVTRIKAVGATNCRVVPMEGQRINDGNYQIEIKDNGGWVPIAVNMNKMLAENLVSQAVNRVICG